MLKNESFINSFDVFPCNIHYRSTSGTTTAQYSRKYQDWHNIKPDQRRKLAIIV